MNKIEKNYLRELANRISRELDDEQADRQIIAENALHFLDIIINEQPPRSRRTWSL